jgi:hypothetical protein
LPHPELCPFCGQVKETINHLMSSCVGLAACQLSGLVAPCFQYGDWPTKKGLNSSSFQELGRSGGYEMTVFNGTAPRIAAALCMVGEEAVAWGMAGARVLPF